MRRHGAGSRTGRHFEEERESEMKVPEGLATLLDYGVIQEVIRPLMSGKEAQVYVVVAGGEECVAKVYKSRISVLSDTVPITRRAVGPATPVISARWPSVPATVVSRTKPRGVRPRST